MPSNDIERNAIFLISTAHRTHRMCGVTIVGLVRECREMIKHTGVSIVGECLALQYFT